MEARYPFLYYVKKPGHEKFFVLIAEPFAYRYANTRWMAHPDLPDEFTLEPQVDLVDETHEFETEREAILFIKEWWKKDENWK